MTDFFICKVAELDLNPFSHLLLFGVSSIIDAMPEKDRHNSLINAIISKAIRIKLDIFDCPTSYYILSQQNYQDLQEIKRLVTELEELDSLIENQTHDH